MQNNDNELKSVKLEQPYSVIRMHNDGDDPNKLKSWERPPHNTSKITKQNLDDAMAVNNVFKDSIDNGNSLQAPEGDSNDYFLKAKNNLVGQQNDRNIGSFLNQFHGMDFFKSGVPEIEKGLKGTGYEMGPSANIADNLKEAVDKGDTKEVENIIEEHPEESKEVLPEDTPIQEEAEQITDDTNKTNDEVNNEVVEDFVEEPSAESDKTVINESMANAQPLTEDNFEPAPEAPYADNVAQIKTDIDKQVENAIETNPTAAEQVAENVSGENSPIETEAEQLNDSNPNNDEVSNEAIEQTPTKEKQEILDKLNKAGSSFINVPSDSEGLIDWDKVKVYKPGEDATVYGIQQEPFDPRVEENLNYDYDQNLPQETSITDSELPDVVDYGLEDQNQYGAGLPSEDETIIDETMANTEPLSDDNFEPAPEAPYADNVVQLKQQKEQLDKELEEAEAEPVTDKESAIRKQNRVKMARAAIANFYASNPDFNNQIHQSDGSVSTGGRVSPRAGIGSIGGGASGHGSMSPVNFRRTNNGISRALTGGGSMPVTLGGNSSKVIQPSRSFSNGSLSSGSFGLMSKNKSNGAFSSKPMSLPNGESSSVVEGVNVDSIAESGKNALVERLKTLLDKLSPEQRKHLGFSPKDYNYQGERLENLDGYTIQKLIEEVEKIAGSF